MRLGRILSIGVCTASIAFALGCADHQWSADNPPPPPAPQYDADNQPPPPPPSYEGAPAPYPSAPSIVQIADRNGFITGRGDGQRDSYSGRPYRARSTRAYYETPGFDPRIGPFGAYQNAFRLSYLRGYDQGYARSR